MERSSAVSSSAPAPEAVGIVRRFIRNQAAGAGLSRGAGQALTLAVSEASANALGDTETSPLRLCPHYAQARALWPGQPLPLGAHFDGAGTNFSVFSDVAERVELCLFDDVGAETRVRLPERSGSWGLVSEGVGSDGFEPGVDVPDGVSSDGFASGRVLGFPR